MRPNYAKLLIFMALCLSFTLNAQTDSIKLSDYKLPNLKRQGFVLGFDLNSSSLNNYNGSSFDNSQKSYALNNRTNVSYFRFLNNEKYQASQTFGLSNSISYSNNDYENNREQKRLSNYISVTYNSVNRIYFNNLAFIGLSAKAYIVNNRSKTEGKYYENNELIAEDDNLNVSGNYRTELPIAFGKGRIERVEDAHHAIYILDELGHNNRLKRKATKTEIIELAKNISEIKNERVLDSRLKYIYELNQIDSVLNAMDLLNNEDITYFAVLNDMWAIGGRFERKAGSLFEIYYKPIISYDLSSNSFNGKNYLFDADTETDNTQHGSNFINTIGLLFVYEKPIRQKFQSTFGADLNYYYGIKKENYEQLNAGDRENTTKNNSVVANINYRFGIYPNTRTHFEISNYLIAENTWATYIGNNMDDIKYKSFVGSLFTALTANYYFSPKLRFYARYSLSFNYFNNSLNNDLIGASNNNHLNMSIVYSVF